MLHGLMWVGCDEILDIAVCFACCLFCGDAYDDKDWVGRFCCMPSKYIWGVGRAGGQRRDCEQKPLVTCDEALCVSLASGYQTHGLLLPFTASRLDFLCV